MNLRRKVTHIQKSGLIPLGLDHFFAMFPATIMVPLLINSKFGVTVIDTALVLLTSGLGTIIFLIVTRGKIPAYIGSSFAYIGLSIFLITNYQKENIPPSQGFVYVGWSYIFAGTTLVLLSLINRSKRMSKALTWLLPAPVIGPVISLIGLELAGTAALDAGLNISKGTIDSSAVIVSVTTLLVIVLVSVIRRKFMKNAAILIGLMVGYVPACFVIGKPDFHVADIVKINLPQLHLPFLSFPPNLFELFLSILPATLVVFTENISRVTVISRMTDNVDEHAAIFNASNIKKFSISLAGHGLASIVAGLLGSVPNTLYAENIAVMSIHNSDSDEQDRKLTEKDKFIKELYEPFSYYPYVIAAIFAILSSFLGIWQKFLMSVPKPVIGGVELFLFGIISAPGIQLLVEQKVNYRKISNQILTASVLISGISGLTLDLNIVKLEGMSLGLVIGIVMNVLMKFIGWTGRLNEAVFLEELLETAILSIGTETNILRCGGLKKKTYNDIPISSKGGLLYTETGNGMIMEYDSLPSSELLDVLQHKKDYIVLGETTFTAVFVEEVVRSADYIVIGTADSIPILHLQKTTNNQYLFISRAFLPEDLSREIENDYPGYVDCGIKDYIKIQANGEPPVRVLRQIIKSLQFLEESEIEA